MFSNKTIDRLDEMLDEAMSGKFCESNYDESKLSRIESRWKAFLGTSVLSNQNLEAERHRLEEFISDISHQTKTPMTNIKMYTELLYEEARMLNDPEVPEEDAAASARKILKYAEKIKNQNHRLEFLVDSLTKLSRLENGTLEIVAKPSDVNELISEAVAIAKPKAVIKNVELVVSESTYKENQTASFDMKWTQEALSNVLDNAVKYSPEGGKVTVSITDTEMYLAIHVVDEGKGISEEESARIFGRFYRSSENQQVEGVGIGLYLTREILSKEDGYIKVIPNDKREGGEFILYLRK